MDVDCEGIVGTRLTIPKNIRVIKQGMKGDGTLAWVTIFSYQNGRT